MVTINWFEVFLPSSRCTIAFETRAPQRDGTRTQTSVECRTVFNWSEGKLYYISSSPPPALSTAEIDLQRYPTLANHAIERGLARRLQEKGFQTFFEHVGGCAYTSTDQSLHPDVYETMEGIRFRSFYGFGPTEAQGTQRWGLVLNFSTRQRFKVSLADSLLRELAISGPVVRIDGTSGSRYLESATDTSGVITERGATSEVQLSEWTLPCNVRNLLNYLGRLKGSDAASAVSTRLQQNALALTQEKRINTRLSRDQLEKLQRLMDTYGLLDFTLELPERSHVRVSKYPLQVTDQ